MAETHVVLSDAPMQPARIRSDSLPELLAANTDFLSALSHELRTPLAAIKGFAQMLTVHWAELPEDKRYLNVEHIMRSTLRLERLIQDLTLAAQFVDAVLQPARVDVAGAVAQAITEVCTLHPSRQVIVSMPLATVAVWADRDRVVQILINLLDNAAKYSPQDTAIVVRWAPDGSRVRLEVCDAGTALDVEEQARLFTRYTRLRTAKPDGTLTPGSGLGLFICKQLVEAMNGAIGVLTVENYPGNTFWFTLPNPDC